MNNKLIMLQEKATPEMQDINTPIRDNSYLTIKTEMDKLDLAERLIKEGTHTEAKALLLGINWDILYYGLSYDIRKSTARPVFGRVDNSEFYSHLIYMDRMPYKYTAAKLLAEAGAKQEAVDLLLSVQKYHWSIGYWRSVIELLWELGAHDAAREQFEYAVDNKDGDLDGDSGFSSVADFEEGLPEGLVNGARNSTAGQFADWVSGYIR